MILLLKEGHRGTTSKLDSRQVYANDESDQPNFRLFQLSFDNRYTCRLLVLFTFQVVLNWKQGRFDKR